MCPSLVGETNTKLGTLPRREREILRQRREILDAALRLFSEKGYHNVSMLGIAEEAEYGMGTLYKLFTNKEDLYKALIMELAEKWHDELLQVLDQKGNPLRVIERYIALRRRLFADNLPIMRLYYAETRGASFNIRAGLDKDLLDIYDDGIEKLSCIFEKGIKEHVFREIDPHQMALALDGTINAFLFYIMKDTARVRDEYCLSTITDIFLRGVLAK